MEEMIKYYMGKHQLNLKQAELFQQHQSLDMDGEDFKKIWKEAQKELLESMDK